VLQTVTRLALRLAFRDIKDAEVAALFDKRSAVDRVVAVELVSRSSSSRDRAESLEAEAELDEQVDVQLHIGRLKLIDLYSNGRSFIPEGGIRLSGIGDSWRR
jgi:hypothetical protein